MPTTTFASALHPTVATVKEECDTAPTLFGTLRAILQGNGAANVSPEGKNKEAYEVDTSNDTNRLE